MTSQWFPRPLHLFAAALILCTILTTLSAQDETPAAGEAATDLPKDPAAGAPEVPPEILDGAAGWLNTDKPLSMKDLRGKVVLFDFWTYCCINCMHVLPDLKFLEEKYPNELVVIGVHSAKFDNEKDSEAIRNAIMRYDIAHPVVNDADMLIWRRFGARGWPTLALVDPKGRYLGARSGEGNRDVFDQVIASVIEYHRTVGTLDEEPLIFELEKSKAAPTPLKYPGKVLADEASGRLVISDTSHNRIVISDLQGEVQQVIGSGAAGSSDGNFETARFHHPQGTCLIGNTLYVADTENHLLRIIDLQQETVATLAGTGEQARNRNPPTTLANTPLNSPWALCHVNGVLYIAMAGPHQIWSHTLGTDTIELHAGNGREDVINGSLSDSSFAQPSGLAVTADQSGFYVADSEGSSIRLVPTMGDGNVTTLAGTSELPRGQSLFAFGDVDAIGDTARFQHPIGVARHDNTLFVADSYNHKIRAVDLQTAAVSTWLGEGQAGASDQTDRLNEPAGLSVAENTLFIADTNNHRICAVDIDTRKVHILAIQGLHPPAAPSQESVEP